MTEHGLKLIYKVAIILIFQHVDGHTQEVPFITSMFQEIQKGHGWSNIVYTFRTAAHFTGFHFLVCKIGCPDSDASPFKLVGNKFLKEHNVDNCLWLLDSPVSNSGRLKTLIGELAQKSDWDWDIKLLISPDAELARTDMVVASSDSARVKDNDDLTDNF